MGSALACLSNRTNLIAWRCAVLCLAAIVQVLFGGCVITPSPPTPSQAVRDEVGVVAVAPAQYVPASNFSTFAKDKGTGAAKGAAIYGVPTAAVVVVLSAAAAVSAPIALPVLVLAGVPATVAATTVGAVEGAQSSIPAKAAQEVDNAIIVAVEGLDVQNALAKQIAAMVQTDSLVRLAAVSAQGPDKPAAQPDYAPLRAEGIDSVLEVAITEIGLSGCIWLDGKCKPPQLLHLYMRAQARLVRVSDGATLFEGPFHYKSDQRELTKWLADNGRLLGEEFEYAYRELAQQIYDEVFLVTSIELPIPWGDCWLERVYPTCSWGFCDRVEPLGATLRWSPFPREVDRQQLDHSVLQKIGKVTYDLKIWEEASELREVSLPVRWRGRLIYERTGLTVPQHTLEVSLVPDRRYYWSVRARFVVDGRLMATRWARRGGGLALCYSNEFDFNTNFDFYTAE